MRPEESVYPEDWFKIGDKELNRAKNLLNLGNLDRYPFTVGSQLTEAEIKESLSSAEKLINKIKELVK